MHLAQDTLETRRPPGGFDFEADLPRFAARYRTLWWSASTSQPDLGAEISWWRQRRNQGRIDRFADRLEGEILDYPAGDADRHAWSVRMRTVLRSFGDSVLPLSEIERQIIFSDAYFDATARFAGEARAFDPDLKLHDLSQALRNVWIMHLLQLLLEKELSYTPSILAYSLLYPYTDNHLDRPDLTPGAKLDFCRRLERRLTGDRLRPRDAHERSVFRLVSVIESQYPRSEFPDVYASLLAIHRAQTDSLAQQERRPCEAEILAVSVEKGGASVLADGMLVGGNLSRDEADFFFGFGVFLQLADDLQDLEQDLAAGHETVFSRCAGSRWAGVRPLDHLVNRLVHFLDGVLGSHRFSADRFAVLRSLIRNSCLQLIIQAAGQAPRHFTRRHLRRLQRHSMTRFSYLRKKGGRLERRYRKLDRSLSSRETSIGSIFEALG
ncbi:MAG: hypothetical protein GY719_14085 [bacterium]|nr:hypothetical protein [bacterium]